MHILHTLSILFFPILDWLWLGNVICGDISLPLDLINFSSTKAGITRPNVSVGTEQWRTLLRMLCSNHCFMNTGDDLFLEVELEDILSIGISRKF